MIAVARDLMDSSLKLATIVTSLAALGYIIIKGIYHGNKGNKNRVHPPGPPQDLLIGNLRQFQKNNFADTFCEWAKRYGPVVYVKLPGISMVILNSYEVAHDVLSKRPNTTSGRRFGYMVTKLMGWGWTPGFLQPGLSHSNQRKMFRRGIGPQRLAGHNPIIERVTAKLMLDMRDFKGDLPPLVRTAMGRLVLEVTYGTDITKSIGEELASWNNEAMKLINDAFVEFWLVDVFHFLRFIPSWMPGATFKKIGKRSSWLLDQIRYKPFEVVKELYKSGKLGHCLATDLLDEFGLVDDARDALATLYTAGADTTTAAIIAFLHAMFLFPHIAEKVHEEIEEVTSGQRMPQVTDRPNLPFTEAAWKEAWRWHPFMSVGLHHVNSQDEIVNKFLIPKGSLIIPNNGFMLTDPNVWGDPEVFRPERFLEASASDLPNPTTLVFGYGIRVCSGMYLADRTGFHIAATTIALYNIVPLEGEEVPDPNTIAYTALREPVRFECRFIPRDGKVENLLKAISLSD